MLEFTNEGLSNTPAFSWVTRQGSWWWTCLCFLHLSIGSPSWSCLILDSFSFFWWIKRWARSDMWLRRLLQYSSQSCERKRKERWVLAHEKNTVQRRKRNTAWQRKEERTARQFSKTWPLQESSLCPVSQPSRRIHHAGRRTLRTLRTWSASHHSSRR